MNYCFSHSTGSFCPENLKHLYNNLPVDLVEVREEKFVELSEARNSKGHTILLDETGKINSVAPPKGQKFDGGKFVPIFTPEEEKEAALKSVLSASDKKLKSVQDGGVLVSGKWFYSDQASWLQYVGHKSLNGALPPDVMWDTMDGTSIVRTQALIGTVLKAIDALNTGAYAVWKQHAAAVKASSDPANYDYSTGWPATYQGQ